MHEKGQELTVSLAEDVRRIPFEHTIGVSAVISPTYVYYYDRNILNCNKRLLSFHLPTRIIVKAP